jgi:predicted nucleotidyltransferase
MLATLVVSTVSQKVLSFLAKYSDSEFYERQIASRIDISFGAANRALNQLFKQGAVRRRQEGRMFFYSIDPASPALPNYKVLVNMMLIGPLVEILMTMSNRVVLFGSCAKGTDDSRSDLDLFIVTNEKRKVAEVIRKASFTRGFEDIRIQPVIKTPVELLQAGEAERVFLDEVEQGIVLWEKSSK